MSVIDRVRGTSAKKLALSGVLLAAGAALAGHGAFATFTSGASGGPQQIQTGTVVIGLGATGSANRLTVNATAVAPGDTIARAVTLSNSGTLNLASVTLGVSVSPSSALDTDATNGLQVSVQSCSVPWTEAGTSPAYTYTCGGSGTISTVLASTPVATLKTTPSTLSNLSSLTASGTDYLVVTVTLPSSAGNSFQNLSSTLTYSFTATQRAAQSD